MSGVMLMVWNKRSDGMIELRALLRPALHTLTIRAQCRCNNRGAVHNLSVIECYLGINRMSLCC